MATCFTCGMRLPEETRCHVETIPEYRDKVGRHPGWCWNGLFPKSSDLPMPELTDEEKQAAQERGQIRFQQLSLEDAA